MRQTRNMRFNEYEIDGFTCSCGEVFFDPDQAQKILLLNKLKTHKIKAKLGRIKSNLILRLPKDVETALNLEKGEEVTLRIADNELRVSRA